MAGSIVQGKWNPPCHAIDCIGLAKNDGPGQRFGAAGPFCAEVPVVQENPSKTGRCRGAFLPSQDEGVQVFVPADNACFFAGCLQGLLGEGEFFAGAGLLKATAESSFGPTAATM